MSVYAGIDVHRKRSQVTVAGEDGAASRQFRAKPAAVPPADG
jgi:hypothetical protein